MSLMDGARRAQQQEDFDLDDYLRSQTAAEPRCPTCGRFAHWEHSMWDVEGEHITVRCTKHGISTYVE